MPEPLDYQSPGPSKPKGLLIQYIVLGILILLLLAPFLFVGLLLWAAPRF